MEGFLFEHSLRRRVGIAKTRVQRETVKVYRQGIVVEKKHQYFLKHPRPYLYPDTLPTPHPRNRLDEEGRELPSNGHDES
jgi:hypothetical protein